VIELRLFHSGLMFQFLVGSTLPDLMQSDSESAQAVKPQASTNGMCLTPIRCKTKK